MTDPSEILEAMKKAVDALEPLGDDERFLALNWIAKALGAEIEAPSDSGTGNGEADGGSGDEEDGGKTAPKDFMAEKRPTTDVQRVTCLAYFLTHNRGEATFKTADLSKLSTEAAQPKFNTSQAVDNAKRQNGYLTSGKGRTHQITVDGEDLVKALPDREAVQKLVKGKPRRRRRTSRRKRKPPTAKS